MDNTEQGLLEKILREIQDVRVIVQENSDAIDHLVEKEDKAD